MQRSTRLGSTAGSRWSMSLASSNAVCTQPARPTVCMYRNSAVYKPLFPCGKPRYRATRIRTRCMAVSTPQTPTHRFATMEYGRRQFASQGANIGCHAHSSVYKHLQSHRSVANTQLGTDQHARACTQTHRDRTQAHTQRHTQAHTGTHTQTHTHTQMH